MQQMHTGLLGCAVRVMLFFWFSFFFAAMCPAHSLPPHSAPAWQPAALPPSCQCQTPAAGRRQTGGQPPAATGPLQPTAAGAAGQRQRGRGRPGLWPPTGPGPPACLRRLQRGEEGTVKGPKRTCRWGNPKNCTAFVLVTQATTLAGQGRVAHTTSLPASSYWLEVPPYHPFPNPPSRSQVRRMLAATREPTPSGDSHRAADTMRCTAAFTTPICLARWSAAAPERHTREQQQTGVGQMRCTFAVTTPS